MDLMDLMDCMDSMDNLIFSSPFCPLGPLGPQNAGLRQKYAVKYKEQMNTPSSFKTESTSKFKPGRIDDPPICEASDSLPTFSRENQFPA